MRRLVAIGIALVLIPSAAAAGRATVVVTSSHPVTVAGALFEARELVRVVVRVGDASRTKAAYANARGSFRVRFALTARTPCLVAASATGSRGSKASWRPTKIACAVDVKPGVPPQD